ncbi:MAG: hypothetical protein ACREGC_01945, partial [Minisyncoccia bacterium]
MVFLKNTKTIEFIMNKYMKIKAGLLFFLVFVAGFSQAVVVSIDRYFIYNSRGEKRTVYLLGDAHYGNNALYHQEQQDIIGNARERAAVCLLEDMDDTSGDPAMESRIKKEVESLRIDRQNHVESIESGRLLDSFSKQSSLMGLTNACREAGIFCRNVE